MPKVGIDSFCNKYYESKKGKKKKRFVIYNGIDETSRVPARWHAWLALLPMKRPLSKITISKVPGKDLTCQI